MQFARDASMPAAETQPFVRGCDAAGEEMIVSASGGLRLSPKPSADLTSMLTERGCAWTGRAA